MIHLKIENIEKHFGSIAAVDQVSLELKQGEIVCLLGPSGCGKTTLLRLVAGLETADSGSIVLNGRDMVDIPTYQRGIGMMFQSYALFPHMNVAENIAYGLKMAGETQSLISDRVNEMLNLVDLVGLEDRRIDQLSGGQQQRVALARSLATRPAVLLLDEPLGSLDRLLRERLLRELRVILKRVGVTAMYVTHDQAEAFGIGDQIAVMNCGKIEQIDAPLNIYAKPETRFVASFLGLSNVFEINLNNSRSQINTQLNQWLIDHNDRLVKANVLIPPHAATLTNADTLIPLSVTVESYSFRGRFALLVCDCGGLKLEFSLDPFAQPSSFNRKFEIGDAIEIFLNPEHFVILND